MALSAEKVNTEINRERLIEIHEIMYLVKRPLYDLCLTVPRMGATEQDNGRPLLQVRFKEQCLIPDLILEIGELNDFFEGLCQLMQYVRAEKVRRREQL
jgi:hypothetical protein